MKASLQKHMMSHRSVDPLFACAATIARVKRLGPKQGQRGQHEKSIHLGRLPRTKSGSEMASLLR
jgi:hypothetical protein